jgi:hypothetical protein
MGRGIRNYDDVWEKLDELRVLREKLCDLVGSDDNNVLLKWIEDHKKISHPCPGKFLLGLTKPKQESAKKTWEDFVQRLKSRGVSTSNLEYTLEKLSKCSTIGEAVQSFEGLFQEIKNDFTGLKVKTFKRLEQ